LSLSLFYEHGKQKLHAVISPGKEATMLHTRLDKNSQIVESGACDVIINGLIWSKLNHCAWLTAPPQPSVSSLPLPVIVRSRFQ